MKMIKSNYIRNKSLICKKIREEYIIINPDNNSFFTINETGETIIRYLYRKRSFDEIESKLNDEFLIPVKRIRKDLNIFLEELLKNGIVKEIRK